jgi:hypothetical protein
MQVVVSIPKKTSVELLRSTGTMDLAVIEIKFLHNEKAELCIVLTDDGIIREVKPKFIIKADSPIKVNPSGSIIELKFIQCPNALTPIEETDDGKITEVKLVFPCICPLRNADSGIVLAG